MEKLENLVARAMEDSNKVAIEYGKRIDSLGETINRRMDGWDEKLDRMTERVSTLERNLADVAASIKPNGKGVLPGKPEQNPKEYCQYGGNEEEDADAAWKQGPSSNFITFNVNELYDTHSLDDYGYSDEGEPTIEIHPHYSLPPMPFPDTTERAKKQSKAYADASRALKLMEGTDELEEILAQDTRFSRGIHLLRDKKRWYEDKSYPLPLRISGRSEGPGDLEQVRYVMEKLGESEHWDEIEKDNSEILEHADANNQEVPGSFGIPCFVNGVAFRKCTLDLGSSYSIMPFDIANAIGVTNIERTDLSLALTDWTQRRVRGYAADIPITIEGYTTNTNFLILNTKKTSPGRIVLGRPFLEMCNAKFDAKNGLVSFRFWDECCTLTRDSDVDVHGRKTNISKMRFFRQLVLETESRCECLGGSITLGRKHRIVELAEEFEVYLSRGIFGNDNDGRVTVEGSGSAQRQQSSHQGKKKRKSKKSKTATGGPSGGGVALKTPPKTGTPRKGTEIFEWRVKQKELIRPLSAGKASIDYDMGSTGEVPLAEKESQGDQDAMDTSKEEEIEPGDKQVDTSGLPPLPN